MAYMLLDKRNSLLSMKMQKKRVLSWLRAERQNSLSGWKIRPGLKGSNCMLKRTQQVEATLTSSFALWLADSKCQSLICSGQT